MPDDLVGKIGAGGQGYAVETHKDITGLQASRFASAARNDGTYRRGICGAVFGFVLIGRADLQADDGTSRQIIGLRGTRQGSGNRDEKESERSNMQSDDHRPPPCEMVFCHDRILDGIRMVS
jgi:hypothetical protein